MPRPSSRIQDEINRIEDRLASADAFTRSSGADGVSLTNESRSDLEARLDHLYSQLDRRSMPRFVRMRVTGLGR